MAASGSHMNEDRVFAKCAWRLIPLLLAAYIANYIDRTNVGFAALTMNRDLGFTPSVYGFGAGVLFVSYGLFQVPSNIMLHGVGARRWICLIIGAWGLVSAASALIQGPLSFYAVRFLLGMTEAGLVPGVILYLTFWFPKAWLGRTTAIFMTATGVAPVIGGPIASMVLRLDGILGIHGWRWLFLIEALPPLLIALAVILLLPDRPARAAWLSVAERSLIEQRIQREEGAKERDLIRALRDPRVLMLGLGYGLYLAAGYGLSFWVPLIIQQMGFANSATALLTTLVILPQVPTMVLWARHSDRSGERIWHATLAALLVAASYALAAIAPSDIAVLLALAAASIGAGCILAPLFAIPPLFLTGPAMAGGFALMNTIGNLLGGFGGQYAIGLLRQQTGSYVTGFAALSGCALATALIVLAVGRAITRQITSLAVPAE